MTIPEYLPSLNSRLRLGNATEHTFRGDNCSGKRGLGSDENRLPNLNMELVDQIATGLGLTFVPEKGKEGEVCFAEIEEVMAEYR